MKNTHKKIELDKWDTRELGASEEFVRKVSAKRARAIDNALGLELISIRLQKNLIQDLKLLAKEEGIGYQPLIRQILTNHARAALRGRKKLKVRTR